MQLRHVVAATDGSPEGRAAVLTAARLGQRCKARVTALSVVPGSHDAGDSERARTELSTTVMSALKPLPKPPKLHLAVVRGLPGVEIGHFAETGKADLVVLGRKRRSEMQRKLLGDTADAVARRSRSPCLFVTSADQSFERILVAVDGTERGFSVLFAAMDFARLTGAKLRVVSVEPFYENEREVPAMLTGRSARLAEAVRGLMTSSDLGRGEWDLGGGAARTPLVIHRGAIVPEIIGEITRASSDLLLVGYHRGGPAGVIDGNSIARRLAHEAPCGVLTIPF